MTPSVTLPVSGDPGEVWRVGWAPDPWRWTPWQFASDAGRFNGRWDDQDAQFRTLYTGDRLRGCFLELLAALRPDDVAFAELAEIEDDDGAVATHPDPERGAIGMHWLNDRLYASGTQNGTYAEVTLAEGIGFLVAAGIFARLGIPPREVDTSLLKDPHRREVTRTVARYVFDLHDSTTLKPDVDGIAFRSRMGDEYRLWAVFERTDSLISERIHPGPARQVTEDNSELLHAFSVLGLHWQDARP
jgi:hypothetical protein